MEATPFLQLIIALGVIIVAAKLGGYASYSLGQPSVLGELLVGIIIGPSLLNLLHLPYFSDEHLVETVAHLGEIGVLLLMFIAGLELHLDELAKTGKVAVFAGILGVVVPLVLGTGLGLLFEFDIAPAVLVGLVLSATSVSISAQTLMELKVLRSRVGIGMMGSAVFDDILVILGLSLLFAVTHSGGNASIFGILWIALRMVLYLVGAWLVGAWLLPKLGAWVEKLPISMGLISFAFVIMLVYAWAAETLGGMAAITGAFLAGLLLARTRLKERIDTGISTISYAIFVPIFFVNVGLSANARLLTVDTAWFFILITILAIIGKVLGAGLGANLAGFSRLEALQLGVGMMSRGEVGLIVATVGIAEGLLFPEAFASIVGMVIVTTLITPPLLRVLFTRPLNKKPSEA